MRNYVSHCMLRVGVSLLDYNTSLTIKKYGMGKIQPESRGKCMEKKGETFLDESFKYGATRSKDYDDDWKNLFKREEETVEEDIKFRIVDEEKARKFIKDGGKTSLSKIDFKVADEELAPDVRHSQATRRWLVFGVRSVIIFLIVATGVAFQCAARRTLPHWFGSNETDMYFVNMGSIVFGALEVLSFVQLLFVDYVLFDITKHKVACLQVVQKMEINQLALMRNKWRVIYCTDGKEFVEEGIEVKSPIAFGFIKKGDIVYVAQTRTDGHHQYYYLGK